MIPVECDSDEGSPSASQCDVDDVEDAIKRMPPRDRCSLLLASIIEEVAQRERTVGAVVVVLNRLLQGLLGDRRALRCAFVALREDRGVLQYYGGVSGLGRRLGIGRHQTRKLLTRCERSPVLSRLVRIEEPCSRRTQTRRIREARRASDGN